jgi:hypothetical protein
MKSQTMCLQGGNHAQDSRNFKRLKIFVYLADNPEQFSWRSNATIKRRQDAVCLRSSAFDIHFISGHVAVPLVCMAAELRPLEHNQ